jgi:DNA-binding IclR family transcriptional regulator
MVQPAVPAVDSSLLARAAQVLNVFARPRPTLTLTEVVRGCGLPQSTVHRLLDQLVQVGWLEREGRHYRLGLRLLELGAFAAQHNRLCNAALPHLTALHEATGYWAHLTVLDGAQIVYLDQVGDPRRAVLPFRAGARLPAHCTAAGKALLAFPRNPDAGEALAAQVLAPRTRRTIVSTDLFALELARVRRSGLAFDQQECFDEVSCVAAPLRGAGWALAAISLSRSLSRALPSGVANADMTALGPKVSNCARAVWSSLLTSSQPGGRKPEPSPSPASTPQDQAENMLYWLRYSEWS